MNDCNKANGGRDFDGGESMSHQRNNNNNNDKRAVMRRKPPDITYCQPGLMRSPSRAQRTETISRNSSVDKRQDPSPPCNTGNSCYPVHLTPPQASLRRYKLEIQRYKSRKIAHYWGQDSPGACSRGTEHTKTGAAGCSSANRGRLSA